MRILWLRTKARVFDRFFKNNPVYLPHELVARLSHETRTSLTGIVGYAEYLETTTSESMVNFTAKIIRESGLALARTSNSFFDLHMINTRKIRLQNTDFVLSKLVWDVVKPHQKIARDRDVSLGFTSSDDVIALMVHMDQARVRQLLDALVFDAVQGAETWSSIHVDLALDADKARWVLTIAPSNGPFDGTALLHAFWNTNNYKFRLQEGPGIELALAKELISLLGGTVTYQTALGEAPRLCVMFDLERTSHSREIA